MKYIIMGFCLAIGWTWGQAICKVVAEKLLTCIERSKWYREPTDCNHKFVEQPDDIKVVKNQIGFR